MVDAHCEATSEKQGIGRFCDGRVSAVIGTHTHVPTADHRILPGGTAFCTDIGMCGDYDSIIGMKAAEPLHRLSMLCPRDASSRRMARQRCRGWRSRSMTGPVWRAPVTGCGWVGFCSQLRRLGLITREGMDFFPRGAPIFTPDEGRTRVRCGSRSRAWPVIHNSPTSCIARASRMPCAPRLFSKLAREITVAAKMGLLIWR